MLGIERIVIFDLVSLTLSLSLLLATFATLLRFDLLTFSV